MFYILSMTRRFCMVQTEENKQKETQTHNSHVQLCKIGESTGQAAKGLLMYLHSTLLSSVEATSCDLHLVLCG